MTDKKKKKIVLNKMKYLTVMFTILLFLDKKY